MNVDNFPPTLEPLSYYTGYKFLMNEIQIGLICNTTDILLHAAVGGMNGKEFLRLYEI